MRDFGIAKAKTPLSQRRMLLSDGSIASEIPETVVSRKIAYDRMSGVGVASGLGISPNIISGFMGGHRPQKRSTGGSPSEILRIPLDAFTYLRTLSGYKDQYFVTVEEHEDSFFTDIWMWDLATWTRQKLLVHQDSMIVPGSVQYSIIGCIIVGNDICVQYRALPITGEGNGEYFNAEYWTTAFIAEYLPESDPPGWHISSSSTASYGVLDPSVSVSLLIYPPPGIYDPLHDRHWRDVYRTLWGVPNSVEVYYPYDYASDTVDESWGIDLGTFGDDAPLTNDRLARPLCLAITTTGRFLWFYGETIFCIDLKGKCRSLEMSSNDIRILPSLSEMAFLPLIMNMTMGPPFVRFARTRTPARKSLCIWRKTSGFQRMSRFGISRFSPIKLFWSRPSLLRFGTPATIGRMSVSIRCDSAKMGRSLSFISSSSATLRKFSQK